ncbi:MAG: type IV pilin [Haloarculaceae archaeon]
MRSLDEDCRGVSEGASVAALVLLTVVVTASVGVGVLLVDSTDEGEIDASVSFQYFSERASLLVTYEEGPELEANSVVLRGPTNEVTWATLRGLNESATISPGARAQLNPNNAYGDRISDQDTVTVVVVEGENETVLGTWGE